MHYVDDFIKTLPEDTVYDNKFKDKLNCLMNGFMLSTIKQLILYKLPTN